MSLRRFFILVFVAFSATLMAVGGWLSWRLTSGALERELDDKLVSVAGAAAETGLQANLVRDFLPGDEDTQLWDAVNQRLRHLQRFVAAAYIFKSDNTVLVSTAPPDSLSIGTRLRWLDVYGEELNRAWTLGQATTPLFELEGRFYKYGFVRLEQSDVMLAVLMQGSYLAGLNQYRRTVFVGTAAVALLAALVAWLLAATVTRPLHNLSRAALRIQRGRMDQPVEVERGDELGRLSRAMERMRVGILQRDEQLRLMLAQVAHEIRNPLGGMELLAAAAVESKDAEEQRRLLGRIRSEVSALDQIIQDFLSFARPVAAERTVHDLRDPVREAAELVQREIEASGGSLVVDLPENPLLARADPDQVKRVVLNLLRNAAEAASHVWLSADRAGREVVVAVRDDGPGIPEELRERIFEPFVSEKESGAGLGLAIVRRMLEANDGRVDLLPTDGDGGSGAEFRVYFRAAADDTTVTLLNGTAASRPT